MNGLMMNFPLTTNYILEYGNRVFPHKHIITKQPDGSTYKYSYHDMYRRTMKLANALKNKLGIKPEDRVATFAWNNYQHLELYYAIPAMGGICHPLNLRLSVDQISFIINHAEDRVVFVDATLLPLFQQVAPHTPNVEHYILLNAPKDIETTLPNTMHYEDLIADESEEFEYAETTEETAIGMCYTSGTTGDPKGVLYSNRSTYLHAMALNMPNATGIGTNDTVLLIVPQFHVMAWGFPYSCMMIGADMVMPGPHLNPKAIIKAINDEGITTANGVPTIWQGVYAEMKNGAKIPSFRSLLVGGSAFPKSLIKGFQEDFNIEAVHAWGMTETSPLGTLSRLQKHHENLSTDEKYDLLAKQGVEMLGVEIRIVTDDGTVAPRDGKTVGEIEVQGNWVVSSYYKAESDNFTEDGWFKTGDVGTLDVEGYMNITDRTKDLIKSGGEWISSVALENALSGCELVKEAAVIAIPDEKWSERPLAAIVLNEGASLDIEKMNGMLTNNSFTKYQLPDKYVVVSEIPKTSVGKIDKKVLRKMYAENKLG
jgi:fatty-acyl-CoA synthase